MFQLIFLKEFWTGFLSELFAEFLAVMLLKVVSESTRAHSKISLGVSRVHPETTPEVPCETLLGVLPKVCQEIPLESSDLLWNSSWDTSNYAKNIRIHGEIL